MEREEQEILDEVKAIEERRRAEAQALRRGRGRCFSAQRLEAAKMAVSVDELKDGPGSEAGGEHAPSLPVASGDGRPPPGVYARGKRVIEVAGEIAVAAVGAGGARGIKRIEQAVEELGVEAAPGIHPRGVRGNGSPFARRRRRCSSFASSSRSGRRSPRA